MSESPTPQQWHIDKSEHDYKVYKYLLSKNPDFVDWEINTIFYSACKLIDAYFIKNLHFKPRNHSERNQRVRTLRLIKNEYQNLYDLSIQSRYENDVVEEDKQDALDWYETISNFLKRNI